MFSVEQVLEGLFWEALWFFMCVPEILQMHVTAQKWNDASKFGTYCELFCFLMRREPGDVLDGDQGSNQVSPFLLLWPACLRLQWAP